MATSKHTPDRVLLVMLEQLCKELGLYHQPYSDGWLVRIASDQQSTFVFGYTFSLNSSSAAEIAKDKVATYHVLCAADIFAVPHYLLRPLKGGLVTEELIENVVLADSWPVVVKPLQGSSGQDVYIVNNAHSLFKRIANRSDVIWSASPLIHARSEIRVVMLDDEVQLMYRKVPSNNDSTDMSVYNLGHGAQAHMIISTDENYTELARIARQTIQAMQLRLAAVDIFQLSDDSYSVLEVNASIAFEHFARHSDEKWRAARACYKNILQKIFIDN